MTTDDVRADARRVLAQIDRAQDEIGAVAADVNNRWRMSIPANPDRDTDLIICDALTSAENVIRKLQSERDAAVAVIANIREQATDVDQYGGHSGPTLARHILNIIGGEA